MCVCACVCVCERARVCERVFVRARSEEDSGGIRKKSRPEKKVLTRVLACVRSMCYVRSPFTSRKNYSRCVRLPPIRCRFVVDSSSIRTHSFVVAFRVICQQALSIRPARYSWPKTLLVEGWRDEPLNFPRVFNWIHCVEIDHPSLGVILSFVVDVRSIRCENNERTQLAIEGASSGLKFN